jgi:hypothetical protein
MSQKRNPDEGRAPRPEGTNSDDKRRKIPNFRNVVLEVMKLHTFERSLEPLIRRVVGIFDFSTLCDHGVISIHLCEILMWTICYVFAN